MLDTKELAVSEDILARARLIKVILMDVDGVLTDGRMYYFTDRNGKAVEFKSFNSHDGLGFHMLNFAGIKTGVISGRESPATVERARILSISHVYQGHLEKMQSFREILDKENVEPSQVAFIGDDFTDLPLMRASGLGCAVANAREEVKQLAHFVTARCGGDGAVREVAELVLKAQGRWQDILVKYGMA
jgi:3-deoxy-D-manno-octulosonate 8-phosphate phosphatase (KDO 8-P phosphatase)